MPRTSLVLLDTTGNRGILATTGVYSLVADEEIEVEVGGDRVLKVAVPIGKKWSHIHIAIRIVEEVA